MVEIEKIENIKDKKIKNIVYFNNLRINELKKEVGELKYILKLKTNLLFALIFIVLISIISLIIELNL